MELKGTLTALVTPLRHNRFDEVAFEKLLEQQVEAGVDGVVVVGTTGESPTLSTEEHLHVIQRGVEIINHRILVIAGTGANATAEAIHLTQEAEKRGADASLQVAPYYNKPSQAGLLAHFSAIAQASKLPLLLYSIPGRCGIEIGVETVAQLAKDHPTIVSIKEAGGSVERVSQLRQVIPENMTILCGDDSLTLPFMSVGAQGVVSVASNLIPQAVVQMVRAAAENRFSEAERLHRTYYPLFKNLLALAPNPVGIKTALARQGWMTDELRLPLVGMDPSAQAQLEKVLELLKL